MRATLLDPYLAVLRVGFSEPQVVTICAVRSSRTISPLPGINKVNQGGIFSVALAVSSHSPGVTWHPALWSPDFPPLTTTVYKPQAECSNKRQLPS